MKDSEIFSCLVKHEKIPLEFFAPQKSQSDFLGFSLHSNFINKQKFSEKIFNSLLHLIKYLSSFMKVIVLILAEYFLIFSIGIDKYWTFFYFWFGLAYMFFICIWLDKMQMLISEPLNKNTSQ
jgi:hypothetical protein